MIDSIEKFRSLYNFIPLEGMTFVFISMAIYNFYPKWKVLEAFEGYPKPAVDFFIEHNLPHPIMSGFGAGGHIMYRLSDQDGNLEHKVAIDGRTNVNTEEAWKAFMDALTLNNHWQDYFDMVKPETIIWKNHSPLTTLLLHEKEWCRVFYYVAGKGGYSVFVKRSYWLTHQSLGSDNCSFNDNKQNVVK